MLPAPVPLLRHVALAEAVSWLILLGIAMPLKYLFHQPLAVKITGALHGLLFVLFCLALLRVLWAAHWPFSRCLLIFASSFIPLLPFFLDRRMKNWENN
jgi:integral membrane protein